MRNTLVETGEKGLLLDRGGSLAKLCPTVIGKAELRSDELAFLLG